MKESACAVSKSAAQPRQSARLTRDTTENHVRGLSVEDLGALWLKLEKSVQYGRRPSIYLSRWDASPAAAVAGIPYDVACDYGLPAIEPMYKSEAVAGGLSREEILARLLQALQVGALPAGILATADVDLTAALRRVPQSVARQFGIPGVG